MQISRRHILGVGVVAIGGLGLARWRLTAQDHDGLVTTAAAQTSAPAAVPAGGDPRLAPRSIGSATAPVTVDEFFSMTCPHCAAFHAQTMPQVRKELVDTGKIRIVFHDFPLDQLALTAAAVARALPPERYEPFVAALLSTQDRWAYARGINNTEELWKMAALAGMSRATFDATIADQGLRTALLQAQDADTKTYQINSTPTFVLNGPGAHDRRESGDMSYDAFAKLVTAAKG